MLTLLPLGSDEQPQSPRGTHRTAVLAAASVGKWAIHINRGESLKRMERGKKSLAFEDLADEVALFCIWCIHRPALLSLRECLVTDYAFGVRFHSGSSR